MASFHFQHLLKAFSSFHLDGPEENFPFFHILIQLWVAGSYVTISHTSLGKGHYSHAFL